MGTHGERTWMLPEDLARTKAFKESFLSIAYHAGKDGMQEYVHVCTCLCVVFACVCECDNTILKIRIVCFLTHSN